MLRYTLPLIAFAALLAGAAAVNPPSSLSGVEEPITAGVGDTMALVNGAMIILREGLEAVLIIGAILGTMRATGAPRRYAGWVAAGVVGALAATLATWVAAQTLLTLSEASRELIEGVTSLAAVAVLFFVTNWLFRKTYIQGWVQYVEEKVGAALSAGSAATMAGLGFIVVYREGLETVLFYQALLIDAQPAYALAGLLIGLAVIAVVAYVMLQLSQRIPLKPFFAVTTALLLVMAFNFTGVGVHEFQEVGLIGETPLPWLPASPALKEVFGLYPTLETCLAQLIFVAAVALTFAFSRWQGKRKAATLSSSRPWSAAVAEKRTGH